MNGCARSPTSTPNCAAAWPALSDCCGVGVAGNQSRCGGQESVYRERGLPWEPRLQSGLPSVLGWVMEGQALPSREERTMRPP